ncbi:MAG: fructose-1,6-bisphosphatase, partial [Fusobacteriaceae bacterium]|nr:fructose-1,6-bisphosphatase [Fusobacteriaceae bacterium]
MNKEKELKYFKLLSQNFPTIAKTSAEIINLSAILNLPKGTEHFITDIHGEYEAFNHILKNCSGVIKEKIFSILGDTVSEKERNQLATVIYYPEEKIELLSDEIVDMTSWYKITIHRMLLVLKSVASKYTSSKIRKALPESFSYIIQELLHEKEGEVNKKEYINEIINTIISIDRGKQFIICISNVIQRLVIDQLHIVGDIYDRGPAPHKIIDKLIKHHNVDIQWGNHDILWMGAAAGQLGCITNAVRICIRYGHTSILEDGYSINLFPLTTFALDVYKDDPCAKFIPKISMTSQEKDLEVLAKMHKAISIIQFKVEGEVIRNNPHFNMGSRLSLDKIDFKDSTITINGKKYPLNDKNFPTIDPSNPYALTEGERQVILALEHSFINSEKLALHTQFLFSKGSIFLSHNSNLLYHGCIPLNEEGKFKIVNILGKDYSGKELLEVCDRIAREGYYNSNNIFAKDFLWYLWCGEDSPLFGKDHMKTFERYFINEKETHKEVNNPYYKFAYSKEMAETILEDFGLNPKTSHIINGHVPVKVVKGEEPIKAGGRLLLIDGGFSKAYQSTTGIAGYTLIFNSHGMRLISHEPFQDTNTCISKFIDMGSTTHIVESLR